MALNPRLAAITRRIIERSGPTRTRYLERIAAAVSPPRAAPRWAAPTRRTVSPPAAARTRPCSGSATPATWPSSPPTTTCSPRTSPTSAFPRSSARPPARPAASRRSPAAFPPCATASPRARPAWSSRSSPATSSRSPPPLRSPTRPFDAAVYLGICDKIVPGLLIGALSFGHLPAVFIPSGPMPSGFSNDDRKMLRQRFAEGLVTRDELLEASRSPTRART